MIKKVILFFFVIPLCFSCTQQPTVVLETDQGSIVLELYPEKAPVSVGNFFKYIDEKRAEKAEFFRTVTLENQPRDSIKIEVVQARLLVDKDKMLPSIPHETTAETGLLHKDGTVSMARAEPGTAAHHFFICINDQPQLDFGGKRNPDGQGFAAFGCVIKGMDVVRKIHQMPAEGQYLKEPVLVNLFKAGP